MNNEKLNEEVKAGINQKDYNHGVTLSFTE
jgi:hypothetical protein